MIPCCLLVSHARSRSPICALRAANTGRATAKLALLAVDPTSPARPTCVDSRARARAQEMRPEKKEREKDGRRRVGGRKRARVELLTLFLSRSFCLLFKPPEEFPPRAHQSSAACLFVDDGARCTRRRRRRRPGGRSSDDHSAHSNGCEKKRDGGRFKARCAARRRGAGREERGKGERTHTLVRSPLGCSGATR